MAITLYAASGSPYVWRVWLALEHKKVAYEKKMLSFDADDLKKPAYLALNPRARVPTITDDGFTLYESAAIVDYLEEKYPQRPVFPTELQERATVRRMIREIDEYVAHQVERMVERTLFTEEAARDPKAIEAVRAELATELARWESVLTGEWLFGTSVTAADHALYPLVALLRRIETRFGAFQLMKDVGPRVLAWMKRVEALPYYEATYPPHWRA